MVAGNVNVHTKTYTLTVANIRKIHVRCLSHIQVLYSWRTNKHKGSEFCSEADNRSTSQIITFLWNAEIRYCVHKSPSLVSILSQSKLSHPISLRSVYYYLCLGLLLRYSDQYYVSVYHLSFPTHLIFCDLMTLTAFGNIRIVNFSLCNFHQSSVTSSLLGPNMFAAPSSQTFLIYVISLMWEIVFHIHTKLKAKLLFCMF
jgi:hypothetical protein